jgi:peptidoglycan/xylan/chitin deacetylase (PgdA/CDA1 family)
VPGLALTFDDGPDPEWTPRLLDLLDELSARATFFPIAARAACHREVIERMTAAGHTVGLHCDAHVRHSDRDVAWVRRDTSHALARLAEIGVRPSLWRTPWGDTAHFSAAVALEYGLRLVGWTIDTMDWRGDSATEMFFRTRESLDTGTIVLAHDGIGPGALREDPHETLDYVRLVADHASRHGLELQGLS